VTDHIWPLDDGVDRSVFACGERALDVYIRRYASQDVKRGVARVFVATPREAPSQLAGFFSLSAGAVRCDDLPLALARGLLRYPVLVAVLGRLGVD